MESVNDKQRKYTAAALLALSVIVIVIAVRGVSGSIRSLTRGEISDEPLVVDPEDAVNARLKLKDTDKDGLSDFDELNLYFSSPYLADSDSDGTDDKAEIDSGGDPNCPGETNCYGAVVSGTNPYSSGSSAINPLDPDVADALKELLPANPTASDIRVLLLSQGVSESALNQITDQQLLDNYTRVYNAL